MPEYSLASAWDASDSWAAANADHSQADPLARTARRGSKGGSFRHASRPTREPEPAPPALPLALQRLPRREPDLGVRRLVRPPHPRPLARHRERSGLLRRMFTPSWRAEPLAVASPFHASLCADAGKMGAGFASQPARITSFAQRLDHAYYLSKAHLPSKNPA